LVLVIEGLLYAIAPGGLIYLAQMAARFSEDTLRNFGLAAIGIGVLIVWVARIFLT
jgi:uncharacterized protein YjeT (DUF2065 family)